MKKSEPLPLDCANLRELLQSSRTLFFNKKLVGGHSGAHQEQKYDHIKCKPNKNGGINFSLERRVTSEYFPVSGSPYGAHVKEVDVVTTQIKAKTTSQAIISFSKEFYRADIEDDKAELNETASINSFRY
ncbi:MAG: hypothetical protein JSR33_02905 [Proteobacteria bacterium]|nr:hypothetical protein [Pseudomonadota bacterium]